MLLLAAAAVLVACSSGDGAAVSDSSASAPSSAVESSAAVLSPSAIPEPSSSPVGTLRDCLNDQGFVDVTDELSLLLNQTVDITSTDIETEADIERIIEALNEQGTDYDKIGRQLKAAPDCGDSKWGMMAVDLGDLYVEIGGLMSGLTVEEALYGDGVEDLNRIASQIRSATNQVEVMTDYMNQSS